MYINRYEPDVRQEHLALPAIPSSLPRGLLRCNSREAGVRRLNHVSCLTR